MTKADIHDAIYEKTGVSKQESARITEVFFELLKGAFEKGETVKIPGFGNFVVRCKKARRGRNPQTGEEMTITERRVLTFKPSPVLKEFLNQKQ